MLFDKKGVHPHIDMTTAIQLQIRFKLMEAIYRVMQSVLIL